MFLILLSAAPLLFNAYMGYWSMVPLGVLINAAAFWRAWRIARRWEEERSSF